ncbi:mitochondrial import protein Pam17-domain-containing protein [Macrophomina phaseolina]|uniref:Presequence translocated-associated motor subunit PAM17 n=1 Tax=Macrophomina phaseolina TaxID=35725 RepID=A0ABQ8GTA1_9PEZI|nr:mitochondrial import protein Pam17-domain-containing protein [Macrophomina phaseolina]
MFSATTLPIRCTAATAAAVIRPRAVPAVRPCFSSSCYSTKTAAATPARPSQLLQLSAKPPTASARSAPASVSRSVTVRLISSTRSARAAATTANASSTTASSNAAAEADTLTWNRFLALRKTRRRLSLFCSIAAGIASTAVGANIVLGYDIDSFGAQTFGLDPFVVMGLSMVGCGCVGWLLGPAIGDGVFRLIYRRIGKQIAEKEKQFFQRIKKFRVDPTQSSLNNPVPDFYGEKIGSVADYRRWLKDQRAFNLKTSGRPRGGAGAVALGKRARKTSTIVGGR